jgi:chorismate-pyruvate lyase
MLDAYYEKRGIWSEGITFRSKGYSRDWHIRKHDDKAIAMANCPPFLRALLVADGTVTKSLEAYYWEPVEVKAVLNMPTKAASDIEWLDVKAGEEVLSRSVLLRGMHSDTLYASAFSIVRLALIPEVLKLKLLAGQLGIGELIRECSLESYREILEFGYASNMAQFGGPDKEQDCVFRSYRISITHRPAILLTECFPMAVYEGELK